MEVLERLRAEDLVRVAVGYRDALRAHQESLNRLNVYPVPDGDTGTNMALTLEAVVAELEGASGDGASGDGASGDGASGMASVCRAISHGSLMGARGNSGVILSQLLRGLTGAFGQAEEAEGAGGPALAKALSDASTAAYQAVMHPVEGTILTVAREAAEAATARADADLVDVLDAAAAAAREALERTPELLPVLAEAGVVDAGGAGFVLLLDVLLEVVAGRPVPAPDPAAVAAAPATTAAGQDDPGSHAGSEGAGGPRYEVMYLLDAPDDAIDGLKQTWDTLGDSIVVVGGDGTWNCHVHTDDIGAAVEAGIAAGRPHRIRVTDLHEQVVDEDCRRQDTEAAAGDTESGAGDTEAPVATAVVAVAAGDGIGRILRSLGVQRVVAGGQSMNPSTAEILAAVESAPGKEVVVLPNNKNIVAVAEQAATSATRPVRVVPTKGVTEAFAALLAYDADADAEVNGEAMAAAASAVVTGEVTQAVRDATTPAGRVAAGDWLGVTADGIVVAAAEPVDAACALLERLVGEGHEVVTVVRGEGASPDDTQRITDWLAGHRSDLTVDVHDGGQPLAAWLFSVE